MTLKVTKQRLFIFEGLYSQKEFSDLHEDGWIAVLPVFPLGDRYAVFLVRDEREPLIAALN
jgi:hypothetical protein